MTLFTVSRIFSLENGSLLRSLQSIMVLKNSVYHSSLGVSVHARLHVASSLFKRFFPHLNMLKYPGSLTTGSYVTVGSSCSASFFACFSLFTILWENYDSLSSVKLFSKIILFYSSSSVEQTCNKYLTTRNSFDYFLHVEQMCEIGICCVPVISALIW